MALSWPPFSLLFDDGTVAFYTKFRIGDETILLGDCVRLRALEPFTCARIVALFHPHGEDTMYAQVKYFYSDDAESQLVFHTDKMETISLIAVVEKVEVVTQFQFENQLFNSETPRQRLFYCSGLKFDMDLNCVTELEAEEPDPVPTEPIKLIPGLRVITSDMILAGVLQQQSDQDSVTSPESPASSLSSVSPAPPSPGFFSDGFLPPQSTFTPPPPTEVKRKRGRPRKHHRTAPSPQTRSPAPGYYYQYAQNQYQQSYQYANSQGGYGDAAYAGSPYYDGHHPAPYEKKVGYSPSPVHVRYH